MYTICIWLLTSSTNGMPMYRSIKHINRKSSMYFEKVNWINVLIKFSRTTKFWRAKIKYLFTLYQIAYTLDPL